MPNFILDIILGVLLVVLVIVGYKRGFLRLVLKIASSFCGLIMAVLFTEPLAAKTIEWGFFNSLSDKITNNIKATEAYNQYVTEGGTFNTQALIEKLGIPQFLEKIFTDAFSSTASLDVDGAIASVTNSIVNAVATVVVFIFLLIFSGIILWFVKKIIVKIRDSIKLIKVVDGILGVVVFAIIGILVIDIFLLITSLIMQSNTNGFTEFMNAQLHLDNDKFGLAKWFYQNNYLGKFISLFF